MKLVKIFFVSVLLTVLVACANSDYNPETCKSLSEKIKSEQTLTQDDYTNMINQASYAVEFVKKKTNNSESFEEISKQAEKDPEVKEAFAYAFGFMMYLSMNKDNLDEKNKELLEKSMKE